VADSLILGSAFSEPDRRLFDAHRTVDRPVPQLANDAYWPHAVSRNMHISLQPFLSVIGGTRPIPALRLGAPSTAGSEVQRPFE
jgi:hypothetical protein